jgi:hypothetical protein
VLNRSVSNLSMQYGYMDLCELCVDLSETGFLYKEWSKPNW